MAVLRRLVLLACALVVVPLAATLATPAAAAADPIQYRYSTMNSFAIYVQPWTNAAGVETGILVYYSVGPLRDRPGYGSHFYGICAGTLVSSCFERTSRAWAGTMSSSVGTWRSHYIPLDCAAGAHTQIEVLQPYVSFARLNFQPWGSPPYQNGQYFYDGNLDSAYLQVIGCHQVWT